ncbi:ERCC4 domain-containing protein [Nanoarchaeota archaeon]
MAKKQLFNIFSRTKKRKPLIKPKAIIDYREKNSLVGSELMLLGLDIEFRELKVADYIVKNVAIERKTVNDFISSMTNKRLLRQLEELQQYKNKLLIIEGIDEQDLYTDSEDWIGVHPNAIRGFLLSILLKYNVPIIFTKNYKDTAKFIAILAKKKTNETISLKAKKSNMNKKEQLQFIVEGFPGIGPKTAQKLLKQFKSIQNIINASEEELKEAIGKKAEILKKLSEIKY